MKLVILDEAEQDFVEGHFFYDQQQAGLGDYFLDSMFADIESLQIYAGVHRIWFGEYHRLLSKRFPFGVYYTVNDQAIRIRAVLDLRANPAWIRERMMGS